MVVELILKIDNLGLKVVYLYEYCMWRYSDFQNPLARYLKDDSHQSPGQVRKYILELLASSGTLLGLR